MVVVYGRPEDPEAFRRRYFEIHVPLAKQLPGLRAYDVSIGDIGSPVGESGAFMIATLQFDDMAALQAAFASEAGKACAVDRKAFAPDTSTFQTFLFEIDEV